MFPFYSFLLAISQWSHLHITGGGLQTLCTSVLLQLHWEVESIIFLSSSSRSLSLTQYLHLDQEGWYSSQTKTSTISMYWKRCSHTCRYLILDPDHVKVPSGPAPSILSTPVSVPISVASVPISVAPGISPMVFPPCPRGPGRPKIGRQGKPVLKKRKAVVIEEPEDAFTTVPDILRPYLLDTEQPKKKGRPPGSKNKAKAKVCKICNFDFVNQVKRGKIQTECPKCGDTVHSRCLEFDGCLC